MKDNYYNIHEAKTSFSKIVAHVSSGGIVIVGKAGVPVVKIVPFDNLPIKKRSLGFAKDMVKVQESFYSPLTDEDLGDML